MIADTPMTLADRKLPVTMSLGVASNDRIIEGDMKELIHAADNALYQAKKNGRNRTDVAGEPQPVAL